VGEEVAGGMGERVSANDGRKGKRTKKRRKGDSLTGFLVRSIQGGGVGKYMQILKDTKSSLRFRC